MSVLAVKGEGERQREGKGIGVTDWEWEMKQKSTLGRSETLPGAGIIRFGPVHWEGPARREKMGSKRSRIGLFRFGFVVVEDDPEGGGGGDLYGSWTITP